MHQANIAALDLNLLVVLHELLKSRNVSRTAEALETSQPSVSRALAKLRRMFGDPLLVRAGREQVLTPRAQELLEPVGRLLQTAQDLLVPGAFRPATAQLTLKLSMFDYSSLVVLPPWLRRLEREAPGIGVEVLTTGNPTRAEDALRSGAADLAVGLYPQAGSEFGRLFLFEERFVCLARRDHPGLTRGLDLEAFTTLKHALISLSGSPGGPVDRALEKLGLRRHIAVRLPHFFSAPAVIAQTDLLLTLPERVARLMAKHLPLTVWEPPIELRGFRVEAMWHRRQEHDPAHRWARNLLSGLELGC